MFPSHAHLQHTLQLLLRLERREAEALVPPALVLGPAETRQHVVITNMPHYKVQALDAISMHAGIAQKGAELGI